MLAILDRVGAIEINHSYQVGGAPKRYRLTPRYREGIVKHEESAPRLGKRIAMAMERRAPDSTVHKWLEHVYLDRAEFSPMAADLLAAEPYATDFQRSSWEFLYGRFLEKAKSYVVAKSGRVTYVPNLIPRKLRRTILIDGEPIVEVDVSASQPRLAASLYPAGHPEHATFRRLIDSGQIYETAASWVGEPWDADRAKQEFFQQVLYGSRAFHPSYPLWGEFEARFPRLASLIERQKGATSDVFPVKLQTIEARIMLTGVATELVQKQIPILGLHDGFAVKLADADTVADAIDRHWTQVTGERPKIKIAGEFKRG